MASVSQAERMERLKAIRRLITHYVTDSPTQIQRLLEDELAIKMSKQTVSKYIKALQDDTYDMFGRLAKQGYADMSHQELIDLNRQIALNLAKSEEAKKGHELANLQHAFKALLERRQVVVEDMVIYPRLAGKMKRHAEIKEPANQGPQTKGLARQGRPIASIPANGQ